METDNEVATAVHAYHYGVIDDYLPDSDKPLPPDYALQDPEDYLEVLKQAIPAVMKQSGVRPEEIVGTSLATRAPEIYRALIEATAFGTRTIIEAFEQQ